MFNIKKEIKKSLCYGFGTYHDDKYGVPYLGLIGAILVWGMILSLAGLAFYGILLAVYEIITRPIYVYNLIISLINKILSAPENVGIMIGTIIVVYSIYSLATRGYLNFLTKHIVVCDRLQPSPEVKQLYDTIISLPIEKKEEFSRLFISLESQIRKDIRKSKSGDSINA